MAVALDSSWKVPVGYFLTDGISGQMKADLSRECIARLHDVGVRVTSLTADGPSSHQTMMKILVAKLSPDNFQAYFLHPRDLRLKIYTFLDVCHMIKLVRGALTQLGELKDANNNLIRWDYLIKLVELQESEGLRLANKLRSCHIH